MTSFKTTITGTELCNRALDMLPADPIPNLDPQVGGLSARTARRWYKPTVGWLLERHHWNLATVRSSLAALPTNTRNGQWRFAYAMPSDAAYVFGIVGTNGTGYYSAIANLYGRSMFERVGDVLYSNVAAAQVDHTSYQTTEAAFSEEFSNIIVLFLASRFAMPITKKPSLAEKYQKDAADALVMAMARNANENQPTYGNAPTETEIARGAGIGWNDGASIDNQFPGTAFDPAFPPIGAPIVPDVGPAGDYLYEG